MRDPTLSNVGDTQKILRSAITHALRLFQLKQVLNGDDKRQYNGVKFHALFYHYGISVLKFGASYYWDTPLYEHAHIDSGVLTFTLTSRRILTQTLEMIGRINKRQRANNLNRYAVQLRTPKVSIV
jgi:hypothetical protein